MGEAQIYLWDGMNFSSTRFMLIQQLSEQEEVCTFNQAIFPPCQHCTGLNDNVRCVQKTANSLELAAFTINNTYCNLPGGCIECNRDIRPSTYSM
jgi:hypothetical protein